MFEWVQLFVGGTDLDLGGYRRLPIGSSASLVGARLPVLYLAHFLNPPHAVLLSSASVAVRCSRPNVVYGSRLSVLEEPDE